MRTRIISFLFTNETSLTNMPDNRGSMNEGKREKRKSIYQCRTDMGESGREINSPLSVHVYNIYTIWQCQQKNWT